MLSRSMLDTSSKQPHSATRLTNRFSTRIIRYGFIIVYSGLRTEMPCPRSTLALVRSTRATQEPARRRSADSSVTQPKVLAECTSTTSRTKTSKMSSMRFSETWPISDLSPSSILYSTASQRSSMRESTSTLRVKISPSLSARTISTERHLESRSYLGLP